MLLAEDLLLLVTDDASGRLAVPGMQADAGLGGANLVELTLLGHVDIAGEQDQGRPGRIIVRDPSPPGDDVLDAALQTLAARAGSKPAAVIRPLGKNLLHALKCEHKVVDPRPYQMSRRQLRARAAEIAQGNWASEAVRKAIDQALAAVAAASAAATAATSG